MHITQIKNCDIYITYCIRKYLIYVLVLILVKLIIRYASYLGTYNDIINLTLKYLYNCKPLIHNQRI